VTKRTSKLAKIVGRLLCFLGFHDYKIIDATLGFGSAGGTSTSQCRRCGQVVTHSSWTNLWCEKRAKRGALPWRELGEQVNIDTFRWQHTFFHWNINKFN